MVKTTQGKHKLGKEGNSQTFLNSSQPLGPGEIQGGESLEKEDEYILVCFHDNEGSSKKFLKSDVLKSLQMYHSSIGHGGSNLLYITVKKDIDCKRLRYMCEEVCNSCPVK